MSLPQSPEPAKLIVSLLLREKQLLSPAAKDLTEAFGTVDMVSGWFPFDYTAYYKPEMGEPLFRRIIVFRELIELEALVDIKHATNAIEERYAEDGDRRINLDPGYMNHARFVLATGKDYAHRIYIGRGIYADLTLIYQQGEFQPLPWTYPDYGSETMREYLKQVRNRYSFDFKRE
ncbi:MAG: DUF4416 family protein [Desulfobacterales bacterium]